MSLIATLAALPLAVAVALGGTGTAVNGATDAFLASGAGAPRVATALSPAVAAASQTAAPAATTLSAGASSIRPMVWGSVIKIVTSKPACIAARDLYNTLPFGKVKCVKLGKVWAVVPR